MRNHHLCSVSIRRRVKMAPPATHSSAPTPVHIAPDNQGEPDSRSFNLSRNECFVLVVFNADVIPRDHSLLLGAAPRTSDPVPRVR